MKLLFFSFHPFHVSKHWIERIKKSSTEKMNTLNLMMNCMWIVPLTYVKTRKEGRACERHSDMGPSFKRKPKKGPVEEANEVFSWVYAFMTKWHTLKHVKDQHGTKISEDEFLISRFFASHSCLSRAGWLWKFPNPILLEDDITLETFQVTKVMFSMFW